MKSILSLIIRPKKLSSPSADEISSSKEDEKVSEENRKNEDEEEQEEEKRRKREEEREKFLNYNDESEEAVKLRKKVEQRLGCLQCAEKAIDGLIQSFEAKKLFCQDYWNILHFILVFTLIFWGIVLEIRGCPALTVMIFFSFVYVQFGNIIFHSATNAEQFIDQSVSKARSIGESLKELVQQCTVICFLLCTFVLALWLDGSVSDILLIYTLCISICIMSPGHLLHSPCESNKEWDADLEEFLPAPTEDNLQVLKRAGDSGDRSYTPPSSSLDSSTDTFLDEEFSGMKMPSHEEGSSDGMEFSELELCEIDGRHKKKRRLRKSQFDFCETVSSSEDDADISLEASKLDDQTNGSDSDFEIIDSRELDDLKNV